MRIILLGTGAALPDPDRCHTSILVTLNNGRHFFSIAATAQRAR